MWWIVPTAVTVGMFTAAKHQPPSFGAAMALALIVSLIAWLVWALVF